MKKMILLLAAVIPLLISCEGSRKVYDWNGVSLIWDTEDFKMSERPDGFTLTDKAKPRNVADFRLVSDAAYQGLNRLAQVERYRSKLRSMWKSVQGGLASAEGEPQTMNKQFPDGIGEYVCYEGVRDGKQVWGLLGVNGHGLNEVTVQAECDNQASRDRFLNVFYGFNYPRTAEELDGEWDENFLKGN